MTNPNNDPQVARSGGGGDTGSGDNPKTGGLRSTKKTKVDKEAKASSTTSDTSGKKKTKVGLRADRR